MFCSERNKREVGANKVRGLYGIVDTELTSPAEAGRVASALSEAGAEVIQLRAKNLSSREALDAARLIQIALKDTDTVFIMNDRVDIALISSADGVHLGTDDLPPEDARKLLGGKAVIGVSTHTIEEARTAIELIEAGIVDYLSVGPIFETTTKADARSVVGLELLKEVRLMTDAPLTAIGGITEERLPEVVIAGAGAGATAIAMISGILTSSDADDIRAKAKKASEIIKGLRKPE